MSHTVSDKERILGLLASTLVGISAIIGAGIFVLGGVAVREAGPGALLAFVANGLIAFLTVLSFAELSTAFPESGGTYTFAKRILSVRAAFKVGWLVWFAHIVAALLYALGFAAYLESALISLSEAFDMEPDPVLGSHGLRVVFAALATMFYSHSLIRQAASQSKFTNVLKLILFGVLILGGFFVMPWSDISSTVSTRMMPLSPFGTSGVLAAMGYTFIMFQGFDSIAAVAGEIREPSKNIPRAMILSLGVALSLYIPFLLIVLLLGVPHGAQLTELCRLEPDTCFAEGARNYLGAAGYWLVVLTALLGTLTALYANLLTASRVVCTMSLDRTLPEPLSRLHARYGTPLIAILTNGLVVILLSMALRSVAEAGAAASLVFLLSFSFNHLTGILARMRGAIATAAFRTPGFPIIQALGAVCCVGLAVFQAIIVPSAGGILLVWLLVGAVLYYVLFASRAETLDAFQQAHDVELSVSRGHTPFVVVPIRNPEQAPGLIGVAHALATADLGRVLLLTVVVRSVGELRESLSSKLAAANAVLREALITSLESPVRPPEALLTVSEDAWDEITRVVRRHRCRSLLLGFNHLADKLEAGPLENLLSEINCDVGLLSAPASWRLENVKRVLVPVAGRGDHDTVRARLLGTLVRIGVPQITLVHFVSKNASAEQVRAAERTVRIRAQDETHGFANVLVEKSDNVAASIVSLAEEYDLVITGLKRASDNRIHFGSLTIGIAREASCATLIVGKC